MKKSYTALFLTIVQILNSTVEQNIDNAIESSYNKG